MDVDEEKKSPEEQIDINLKAVTETFKAIMQNVVLITADIKAKETEINSQVEQAVSKCMPTLTDLNKMESFVRRFAANYHKLLMTMATFLDDYKSLSVDLNLLENKFKIKSSRTNMQNISIKRRFSDKFNKINSLILQWNSFVQMANAAEIFSLYGQKLQFKLPSFASCDFSTSGMSNTMLPQSFKERRTDLEGKMISNVMAKLFEAELYRATTTQPPPSPLLMQPAATTQPQPPLTAAAT